MDDFARPFPAATESLDHRVSHHLNQEYLYQMLDSQAFHPIENASLQVCLQLSSHLGPISHEKVFHPTYSVKECLRPQNHELDMRIENESN